MSAGMHRCTKFDTWKELAAFHPQALSRSFSICRACSNLRSVELRRTDPASRLAARLRMREKRAGGGAMQLGVKDIRRLLQDVDPMYVENDLVTLVRIRRDEPLAVGNVAVKRTQPLPGTSAPSP